MRYFSVISIFLLFVISSCKKDNVIHKETIQWHKIEISTGNQIVTIYENLDTASFQNAIYKRISKKAFMGKYKLNKIEHTNFKMNRAERDSIYSFVIKTITKPYFPEILCTDYVGNVSIKLSTSNTTLSCDYNSVCDWSTVSPETQKNI